MKSRVDRGAVLILLSLFIACSTPGRREARDAEESPLLPEEARDAHPVLLPRALPLEGSGGADGVFFPSRKETKAPAKPPSTGPDLAGESDKEKALRERLLQDIYKRFRRDPAYGAQLDAPTLNDLALLATTMEENDRAETLFLLALAKEDSLPIRLNLAFLYMRQDSPRGRAILDALRERLAENRKAAVVRELFARRFENAAVAFVESWFREAGKDVSPSLVKSVKITASYFEIRGESEEASRFYMLLDAREKADPEALFGLARNLPPDEARVVYRRILALPARAFTPDTAPADEVLRASADLSIRQGDFAGAEHSLARLRSPRYEDVKARAFAKLRQNPDENVEPLIQMTSRISVENLRRLPDSLFPGNPSTISGPVETGFPEMMRRAFEVVRPAILPAELRMEIFGTPDPAQAEKDRRALRQLY